ncbi:MAG: carboxypeptidase-like regulatory domain-containing protein [Armatimonadota bacterium]
MDIVLSINEIGQASSWIQKFTNIPGRGEFIRVADRDLNEFDITPEFLEDLKRVAEYSPPGTVSSPLDTGLEGVLSLEGKPLAASNVWIRDASGKIVAWSATDNDGRFFAFLLPGEHKVDLNVTPSYGAAPVTVTLTAGKITSVPPIDMVRFPSIDLIKENRFQWLAYLSPDITGDESYADPKASEANFEPWDVTAASGNWTPALLDAKGIPNGNMHGWLRLHVTLPVEWGQRFRGDLRLYGFNFNASDEAFFKRPVDREDR